jgi:hypothetical protein
LIGVTLKIAIFEFICGSGTLRMPTDEEQSASSDNHNWTSLLNEGVAMLVALADDLRRCGIDVHTVLEPSIAEKGISSNRGFEALALDADTILFDTNDRRDCRAVDGSFSIHGCRDRDRTGA